MISEMVSRQLHLGASCCFGWIAAFFVAICGLQVRCSNPVPGIPWNDVTIWNIEKWPTATFCEKTTKASHRKQSDGRN